MPSEGTYLYHAGRDCIQGFENRLFDDLLHLSVKQDLVRHLTSSERQERQLLLLKNKC